MSANVIVITTAKGMVPLLAAELNRLGYAITGETLSGVSVTGTMADAMRMNLHLRTAHRVLWQIGDGAARDPGELFKRLLAWPWENWIPARGHVCVTASGRSAHGDDPRFVALKVKDAMMDRLAGMNGRRPDAGPERTHTVVHAHWEGRFFTVYLDTSGEPLSHRGYRLQPHTAPMRETLAAACLLAARWTGDTPMVNPMCGSGTLAIEAALIASGIAPGTLRTNFGFMHINSYDADAWRQILEKAAADRAEPTARIMASDHDPAAITAALANARRAGVATRIEFREEDFRTTPLPPPPGLLIFNPGYGERLDQDPDLAAHYRAIGDFMKHHAAGYTGAVFTGNAEMVKEVGLKPRTKVTLFNGPLECRLLLYDLYGGTKRDRRLKREANPSSAAAHNAP